MDRVIEPCGHGLIQRQNGAQVHETDELTVSTGWHPRAPVPRFANSGTGHQGRLSCQVADTGDTRHTASGGRSHTGAAEGRSVSASKFMNIGTLDTGHWMIARDGRRAACLSRRDLRRQLTRKVSSGRELRRGVHGRALFGIPVKKRLLYSTPSHWKRGGIVHSVRLEGSKKGTLTQNCRPPKPVLSTYDLYAARKRFAMR